MPTAKENFLSRFSNFERIVSPENVVDSVLTSGVLTDVEHNEKVKMLRNGMAIVGFTILEDFIKRRAGEILTEIGTTPVMFGSLPLKLREAATVGALKGIQSRAEVLKRNSDDYVSFIQDETANISSTINLPYEISEYSLGWEKSNLSSEDINRFLSTFNVSGGWGAIQLISSAINISLANPNENFKNSVARRHEAAHNSNAESLLTDLQDYVSQARVIAFAFDVLISKSLSHIKSNNSSFLDGTMKTSFSQLSFRFLTEVGNVWKEYNGNSINATRVKNTLAELRADAEPRADLHNQVLVLS